MSVDEPLVVPSVQEIDQRIDSSIREWREWAELILYQGRHREWVVRNALALKLLLFSPTGAISAAATTSLPEKIGGHKNYDYRYAWVRDASYTIKAFLTVGLLPESQAAFKWLLKHLDGHGPLVCFTLNGSKIPSEHEIDVPGYRDTKPVVIGNKAGQQLQMGVFGDIFETALRFVEQRGLLDGRSAETLSHLADYCAEQWRRKDSGIWELEDLEHYTNSKISCWQALHRAVQLADRGQLPTTCRDRWERERDRIETWINENCWSEELQAYEFYPKSGKLDCSIALAAPFEFPHRDRLIKTLDAIDANLKKDVFHYRYSGVAKEEGCFLACTYWIAEARAILGQKELAEKTFAEVSTALKTEIGVYSEMIDPESKDFLGNFPQGLTHLAMLLSAIALDNTN